ncbi:hypothetical protein LXL04_017452 [Taraxacum kok-saghyz]
MVSKMKTRHGNSGIEPEKENDVGGIASYELAREQRIKENLERMHKLGILELSRNLKPTKTSRPYRRKPPPSPKSQRRSSRIPTIPTVDYSHKRVFKAPDVVKIEIKGCHQCRHKTSSHRTNCCTCKAIQGQFCGDCLFTRYGENVLEAMENPDWVCPVCRDICNCIQCRKLKGLKPLGSVYFKALRLGFKSVAHYLIQFQGPNGKQVDIDDEEDDDDKMTLMMRKKILKLKKRSKNDH